MLRVNNPVQLCKEVRIHSVFFVFGQMPVSCQMQTGGGLSWHPSLPVCATGGGNKVHLWFLEV